MDHFAKAVDALDAAIFSGDSLGEADTRKLFAKFLERWKRKLLEAEREEEKELK